MAVALSALQLPWLCPGPQKAGFPKACSASDDSQTRPWSLNGWHISTSNAPVPHQTGSDAPGLPSPSALPHALRVFICKHGLDMWLGRDGLHANSRLLCQGSRGLTQKCFYKRHAVGAGCSAAAKLVFFVCEVLNSILNMVGCGA